MPSRDYSGSELADALRKLGEGGVLAMTALLPKDRGRNGTLLGSSILVLLGIFGAALLQSSHIYPSEIYLKSDFCSKIDIVKNISCRI